jgi:hypothetical protein
MLTVPEVHSKFHAVAISQIFLFMETTVDIYVYDLLLCQISHTKLEQFIFIAIKSNDKKNSHDRYVVIVH